MGLMRNRFTDESFIKCLGDLSRRKCFSNRAVSADRAILDDVLKEFEIKFGEKVFITKIRPEDKAPRFWIMNGI